VVVEGAVRSGALNMAHWATNPHRPVMGMPGPVTSTASAAVHQLIRLGEATLVTNAQEVLTDITTPAATARSRRSTSRTCPALSATRRAQSARQPRRWRAPRVSGSPASPL